MTHDDNSESNKDPNDNQVEIETNSETDDDQQNQWQTAHPRKTTTGTKTQSQLPILKHTKRKADKARLFMAKNLSIHTPVTKRKNLQNDLFLCFETNVFSLNCRGLKDHGRLQIIVNQCLKHSDLDNLCICLHETKITNITNNHLKILEHYHLSYNKYPSEGQSGGLLTIFPENYILLNTHKSSNTKSLQFSQHNFTLTNTYIKPTDYHLQQFLSVILAIENFQCNTHVICGDFNALPSFDCTSNRYVANNDFRLLRYHHIIDILHNLHVVRVDAQSPLINSHIFIKDLTLLVKLTIFSLTNLTLSMRQLKFPSPIMLFFLL